MKDNKGTGLAVVAYLTFVGMIIAFFLNKEKPKKFVTLHVQNMFGLVVLLFISQTTQAYIDPTIGHILWWVSFFLWAFSLVTAIIGQVPSIPILSNKFAQWFVFLR